MPLQFVEIWNELLCGADSLYMSIMYDIYRPILPPADQEQVLTRGDSEFFFVLYDFECPHRPLDPPPQLKTYKSVY